MESNIIFYTIQHLDIQLIFAFFYRLNITSLFSFDSNVLLIMFFCVCWITVSKFGLNLDQNNNYNNDYFYNDADGF